MSSRTSSLTQQSAPSADLGAWLQVQLGRLEAQTEGNPLLPVGGQQLRPFCHNALQLAVLALPGRDVEIVRGSMTGHQINTHRPSYINALLIASRGRPTMSPCGGSCQSSHGGRPFPRCIRLPGHFDGSCASCKWRDWASTCSVRDVCGRAGRTTHWGQTFESGFVLGEASSDLPALGASAPRQTAALPPVRRAGLLPPPGDSSRNPIQLNEDGSEDDPIVL
jgi:hypothetical protein